MIQYLQTFLKKIKMITFVLIKVITVIIFTQIKKTVFAFNFTNNPDKILWPSLVNKSVNFSWFSFFFETVYYRALKFPLHFLWSITNHVRGVSGAVYWIYGHFWVIFENILVMLSVNLEICLHFMPTGSSSECLLEIQGGKI